MNAYFQQTPVIEVSKMHNIVLTAYSAPGTPTRKKKDGANKIGMLDIAAVIEIANRLGKNTSQISLKFLVQQGINAIPRSTNPHRLRENKQVRSLSNVNLLKLIFASFWVFSSASLQEAIWFYSFQGWHEYFTQTPKGIVERTFSAEMFPM